MDRPLSPFERLRERLRQVLGPMPTDLKWLESRHAGWMP